MTPVAAIPAVHFIEVANQAGHSYLLRMARAMRQQGNL
jgi:hypothetical protein